MLCRFMLIYANLKKDFRRAKVCNKVCKYIQKNMLKQIQINVCNFMQIYANLCKWVTWPTFKNMASAEPKYVHKFRKNDAWTDTNKCMQLMQIMQMSHVTYFLKI